MFQTPDGLRTQFRLPPASKPDHIYSRLNSSLLEISRDTRTRRLTGFSIKLNGTRDLMDEAINECHRSRIITLPLNPREQRRKRIGRVSPRRVLLIAVRLRALSLWRRSAVTILARRITIPRLVVPRDSKNHTAENRVIRVSLLR